MKNTRFGMLLLVGLLVVSSLYSQAIDTIWTRTYGGSNHDDAYQARQTSDGGYIIVGETQSYGVTGWNSWLIKTDSMGNSLWNKTYRYSYDQGAYAVYVTSDGGYILAGRVHINNIDLNIIKTDSVGDTLWTRRYGGSLEEVSFPGEVSIQQTTDNGYIIATNTKSFGAGGSDGWILKLDSNGDTMWTKTFGGSSNDYFFKGEQTTEGGYIFVGYTASYGAGSDDVYIVKTDSLGNILWSKTYGGSNLDHGYAIHQTYEGGYIVAGETHSFGAGNYDYWLLKLDSNGDTIWTKTYGNSIHQGAYSVQQAFDKGYILAGRTHTTVFDLYLVKTDSLGNEEGSMIIGGSGQEINIPFGCNVTLTSNGDFLVAGNTNSFGAGNYDAWLLLVDGPDAILTIDSTTIWSDTSFAGPFPINTKVTSAIGIDTVLLFYKRLEDPAWNSIGMSSMGGHWFFGNIPQAYVNNDTIKYYILARDNNLNEITDPVNAPVNYYSFVANLINSIEENIYDQPDIFSLSYTIQTNNNIIFKLSIQEQSYISLKIYDMSGRVISIPINGNLSPDKYEIPFISQSKGVYFYKLESMNFNQTGKFVLF